MDSVDRTIAVIMSTYNGELFLAEQIDSILAQEEVDVKLFVRDDGSDDNTPKILLEYAQKYPVVHFCNQDNRENIGIKNSFLHLLKEVMEQNPDIAYFAFSDQDDVWKKDKLKAALSLVNKTGKVNGPQLYYSNKTFVNKNLSLIAEEKIRFYGDFFDVLWPSLASGCTMVFNRVLAEYSLLKEPSDLFLHDSWIYRLAILCGADIVFDEQSHILYRQHGENTCGIEATKLLSPVMAKRLFTKSTHKVQRKIREINDIGENIVCEPYKKYVHWILMYNKDISSWFHLAISRMALRRGPVLYFTFLMKLILFKL